MANLPLTNQKMVRGDDYSANLTISENGSVVNITGYQIIFTLKSKTTDKDVNAIYQQINTTHTTPAQGITSISISSDDSINIPVGKYYYDVQMKDTSNKITTILRGTFEVEWGVTDSV